MRVAASALLLLWLAASSAAAQTAVVAKRRPAVPTPPASAPPPAPAPALALPAPPTRLSLTGLRSPGDGGSTCRSTCARTRYLCEVQESSCAQEWTSCVKTCGDPTASGQSALLPR